ncbi:hypothetical protein, partial [Acinetobacter baumannii]|uniref:hypothetical protein n=1 Tax=Acinetobacter baumannii TaxID=470 RepID=UPI001C0A0A80
PWLIALGLFVATFAVVSARAEDRVQFPSLDGKTTLSGFLSRPPQGEPAAAVVMLHGCSGLVSRTGPFGIYRAWRDLLIDAGYIV